MEKKYRYEDASVEDQKAFKEGVDKLLNELSLAMDIGITKTRVSSKQEDGQVSVGFVDVPVLILNKKIEEVEAEVVSPIQQDELNKEA